MARPLYALSSSDNFCIQRTQDAMTRVTFEGAGPESGVQVPTRMTVATGQGPMSREPREKEQRQD